MPISLVPLRQSRQQAVLLPVVMSGVCAGERVLQIGIDDVAVATAIAGKPGINGRSAFLLPDERTATLARTAAEDAMAVADIEVSPPLQVPFDDEAFDVGVLHARTGVLATLEAAARQRLLGDILRTLRPGGRLLVMTRGTVVGLAAWLRRAAPTDVGVEEALRQAGYRPVRVLADREGYLFTEGLRPTA